MFIDRKAVYWLAAAVVSLRDSTNNSTLKTIKIMPIDSSDLKDTRPLHEKKSDDDKWKQAKAYLKSKNTALAKTALEKLTDHENPYKEKATKLLQELK